MWLTDGAIRRPLTIMMLVLGLMILGLQSMQRMPVDLMPKVDIPYVSIITVYKGAGPNELETLVSKKIEEVMSSVNKVKNVTSISQEGVSIVVIEFQVGVDLDTAASDVRDKLDTVSGDLPDDAEDPIIYKLDFNAQPIMYLGMSGKRSAAEIKKLADDVVKDRLGKVSGVASVSVTGGDTREIFVKVDQERLKAGSANILEITQAIAQANLNIPAGNIKQGAKEYTVRVMGEFVDPQEIQDMKIKRTNVPGIVELKDLATVLDTSEERTQFTRLGGKDSVGIVVQKQADANTVQVADGINEEITKLKRELPPDINIEVSRDNSLFIRDSLRDVSKNIYEAAILATLVVFVFLHVFRATFIILLAIPTSILATFLPIYFFGFSLNSITLMGLALSVGILVDDSIVVLENIFRHLTLGESPRDAAFNGRMEIGGAAVAITMTDVVVYLPIAFMGGIVGMFFRQFGITVATATLFSLFMSFTLTPMLASRWLRSSDAHVVEAAEKAGMGMGDGKSGEGNVKGVMSPLIGVILFIIVGIVDILLYLKPGFDSLFILIGLPVVAGIVLICSVYPKVLSAFFRWFDGNYSKLDRSYRKLLNWAVSKKTNSFVSFVATFLYSTIGGVILGVIVFVVLKLLVFGWKWLYGYFLNGEVAFDIPLKMVVPVVLIVTIASIVYFFWKYTKEAVPNKWRLPNKWLVFLLGNVVLVVSIFLVKKIDFEFMPQQDQGQFNVTIEMPIGTNVDETNRITTIVESRLMDKKKYPEVDSVFTTVGSAGTSVMGTTTSGSQYSSIMVRTVDKEDRKRTVWQIMADLGRDVADIPGPEIRMESTGMGGSGQAPVSVQMMGLDTDEVLKVANQVEEVIKTTQGTRDVLNSWQIGKPEIQVVVDRVKAAQYGLSLYQIALTIRNSIEGDTTSKYREKGDEYDIRIRLDESNRKSASDVENIIMGGAMGNNILLKDVAKVKLAEGPTKLERKNRMRMIKVEAQLVPGYPMGNVNNDIQAKLSEIIKNKPEGVNVFFGGEAEQMREAFTNMISALILAILLVYMLMCALFESMLYPFIIMFALPQALIGALWALFLSGKSLSMVSMIGMIMLVGLVTKNAILLVDYTNTLRKKGKMRDEALVEAGPVRLRPILMTTLTVILGNLPIAMGLGKGSEFRSPMSVAVIGGLLVSMLLTLIVIPCTYSIVDDVTNKFTKKKKDEFSDSSMGAPAK